MNEARQSEKNVSLAILPFRFPQNDDQTNDLLGIGLADALTIEFHKIENLNARPVSQVKIVLSKTADSFAAGELLEVDYLLEGYIFPARERTRFTVQLLKIKEGSVVWAGQFDESETDALLLEDLISTRVVEAVRPHLLSPNRDFVRKSQPITGSFYQSSDTNEITGANEDAADENEKSKKAKDGVSPPDKTRKQIFGYPQMIVLSLVLLIAVSAFFVWRRGWLSPDSNSTSEKTLSIIVLPFQSADVKSVDNSLGAGLAESITDNLGSVKNLFVLSASAGRRIAEPNVSPAQIKRDFNADYLLRGKIAPDSAESIRVVSELVKTSDESIVWTKAFKAPSADLRQLHLQIFEEVLKVLSIEISDADKQKISQRQPNNGLAYELYLAGRYQMATRTETGLRKAVELFSQSLAKDSDFALAHVGLADAYSLQYLYQIPPPADAYRKAKKNAARALEINENLAEAHTSLAYILFNGERNRAEAEREYRRAIELNPSYATAHHWFALALSAMGRRDEAISEIETARKLNPRSTVILSAKAMMYYHARQYAEAVEQEKNALQIDAGYVPALKGLRWAYTAQKNYAAARDALLREKSFGGATEEQKGWLIIEAQVEAVGKNPANARVLLEEALRDDFVRENPAAFAWEIALAFAELNDREKTLEWLEKAESAPDHGIIFIEVEPRLQKYRTDERFVALADKVKTPLQK